MTIPTADSLVALSRRLVGRSWVPQTRLRRLIFAVAAIYALVQMTRGVYLLFTWDMNDLTLLRNFFWSILAGDPIASPYPAHSPMLLA